MKEPIPFKQYWAAATATLPIRQFLAYNSVVSAIKEHILKEHIGLADNGYQYQCNVCGYIQDSPKELLLMSHHGCWTQGDPCWVGDIVEIIQATNS